MIGTPRAGTVGRVAIRWLTAVLDVPGEHVERACAFWTAVTATSCSGWPGQAGESTALVPGAGDVYLRMQRVDAAQGGCHLDVHTDNPSGLAEIVASLGGTVEHPPPGVTVLGSPGGFRFCAVAWRGEKHRPSPQSWPSGHRSLVDQLCLDIPPGAFDAECDFWAALTGLDHRAGGPGFRYLPRPAGMPLRLLLQRLDDPAAGAVRAHLDLACSDIAAERRRHEALGATMGYQGRVWITLRDPAGTAYCITRRNPDTGTL